MSGRLGLAQTLPEVGALHRLVEETPHERVAAELARLIRDGLDHRRTLTALAVATSRRVQPFPDVGFKYHTVLALQSAHLTALNLPDKERWLPVFWALDYFKRAQEAERRQSGWTMGQRPDPVAGTVEAARKSLIDALDRWDLEAVDPAILDFARLATPEQLSEFLFRYGTRDLRAIGHKAIAVQNVHRLLPIVGPEYAPPVLRSLAAALQNHGNDPNPATSDLPSDRTWREFQTMLGEIPKTWKQGRRDGAARNELVRTLREVSELDAGRTVIDLLKHGVSTDSIWEGLFATAAELVLRRPTVVPVHAQTSANAFHYVFRHARAETTQLLALLQSAAFMPAFRRRVGNTRPDLRIDELEPLAVSGNGAEALREAFSELLAPPALVKPCTTCNTAAPQTGPPTRFTMCSGTREPKQRSFWRCCSRRPSCRPSGAALATRDPICASTSWNLSRSPATARKRCARHSPNCRTIAPPALVKPCTTCNTAAPQTGSLPAHAGNWLAMAGSPTTTSSRRPRWRTIGKCRPPRGGTEFCPPRWHTS